MHVRECRPGEGTRQYARFYGEVDKRFVLGAEGREDVPLRAARGYWVSDEAGVHDFYLRIEPGDLARMAPDEPYVLAAENGHERYRWDLPEDVVLVRPGD